VDDTTEVAAWTEAVLRFWFTELEAAAWFRRDPALDDAIRLRFGPVHAKVLQLAPDVAAQTVRGGLAAVIVLDQFSRNMFRGTPAAFASDPKALAIADGLIRHGWDTGLTVHERWFLYLPFEHSEDRAVQVRSLTLFEALGDPVALDFARQHKAIIDRFGRYPHRNAVLGRTSSAEELAFLAQPGSSF
jgi:uncharacterized protein (DUF924 family)